MHFWYLEGAVILQKNLSEKGTALLAKFKKFQKISLFLYALAAMSFVFLHNPLMAIAVVVLDLIFLIYFLNVLDIFLEVKIYICPHCGKTLDCRRKVAEDTCCPRCEKYLFRGLD